MKSCSSPFLFKKLNKFSQLFLFLNILSQQAGLSRRRSLDAVCWFLITQSRLTLVTHLCKKDHNFDRRGFQWGSNLGPSISVACFLAGSQNYGCHFRNGSACHFDTLVNMSWRFSREHAPFSVHCIFCDNLNALPHSTAAS